MIRSNQFENAIACLKQVKEQYCPRRMLNQIEDTFKLMDEAKCEVLGELPILLQQRKTASVIVLALMNFSSFVGKVNFPVEIRKLYSQPSKEH